MNSFGHTLSAKPQHQQYVLLLDDLLYINRLILYNDDVNTFDWVIECLVKICSHELIQAEQCAYLVHYKGKCCVKEDTFDTLKPMALALLNRGLSVVIE